MTQQVPTYETLPGGSIDYAYYQKRAHAIRSDDAHRNARTARRWLRGLRARIGQLGFARPRQFSDPVEAGMKFRAIGWRTV